MGTEFEREFNLLEAIETLTPELMKTVKGTDKPICANVDLYSGLVYRMRWIPGRFSDPSLCLLPDGGLGGPPDGRDVHQPADYASRL